MTFESYETYYLKDLEYSELMKVKIIDPTGQIIEPKSEYTNYWSVYTCLDYCAIGYYKLIDGSCGQCDNKCRVCLENKSNCLFCSN